MIKCSLLKREVYVKSVMPYSEDAVAWTGRVFLVLFSLDHVIQEPDGKNM